MQRLFFVATVTVLVALPAGLFGCGGGGDGVASVYPTAPVLLISTTPLEWGEQIARAMKGKYLCSQEKTEILSWIRRTTDFETPCLVYFFGDYIISSEFPEYDDAKSGLRLREEKVLPFVEISRAIGWKTQQVLVFDGGALSMQYSYLFFDRDQDGTLYGNNVRRASLGSRTGGNFGYQFFKSLLAGSSILEAYRSGLSGEVYLWGARNDGFLVNWRTVAKG